MTVELGLGRQFQAKIIKSKNQFNYIAFSCPICSDRKIPFFLEGSKKSNQEINIRKKSISNSLSSSFLTNSNKITNKKNCIIYLKNEVLFDIHKNGNIFYEELVELKPVHFSKLLCNMALPMYFVLNENIALHASSLVFNSKTLLFSGPSGCGKSTISKDILDEGGKLISEDLSVISKGGILLPAYPVINIKQSPINNESIESTKPLDVHNKKLAVNVKGFCNEKTLASIFFFLKWGAQNKMKKLSAKEAFFELLKNSWHSYPYNSNYEFSKNQIQNLSETSQSCSFYSLERDKQDKNKLKNKYLVEMVKKITQ